MTGNNQQTDSSFKSNAPAFPLAKLLRNLVAAVVVFTMIVLLVKGFPEQEDGHRKQSARTQIESFGTALETFEVDNDFYPAGPNGLQALVVQPECAKNWHPYLKSIPKDPWQHDYVYQCPGQHNTKSYDIASMGPNGRLNDNDDITNWKRN